MHTEHCACVAELEADIKALKRRLAANRENAETKHVPTKGASPFAHLPPADRRWMERKLGGKKG